MMEDNPEAASWQVLGLDKLIVLWLNAIPIEGVPI